MQGTMIFDIGRTLDNHFVSLDFDIDFGSNPLRQLLVIWPFDNNRIALPGYFHALGYGNRHFSNS